jgi:hypothetical protein
MHFPGRCVGRDGPIPWPPRSHSITPLDFFLWGDVKDIVYKTLVTCLDELKLRIVVAVEAVTPQMLENPWREIKHRLGILRVVKGAHVEAVAIVSFFIISGLKIIAHGNADNNLE